MSETPDAPDAPDTPDTPDTPDAPRWQATGSAIARATAGGTLLLVGLLAGRSDVAVLGVPLVLVVAWGVVRRPRGATRAMLDGPRARAGEPRIEAALSLRPVAGTHTTRLRVQAHGHRDLEALVSAGTPRRIDLHVVTARTGRQRVFTVDVADRGPSAVLGAAPAVVGPGTVVVLPRAAPLGDLPLPHRLRGLTGAHRSSQPGDGGELRDVAVFGPGDRLRRIDWKATARRAASSAGSAGSAGNPASPGVTELYVRRTFATADAHVMLVLDARDAVGPNVASWDTGDPHPEDTTSLDLARHAGASLARHFLDQGDRVGLTVLGRYARPLRPAAGSRHLTRVLHHLAAAEPDGRPTPHLRAPQIPAGCLVVVLSSFIDDDAARLARTWRHTGHRTIAVDVVPRPVLEMLRPRARLAHRIVELERQDRLAGLTASGVEVVSWDEARTGEPVAVTLSALSRTRRVGR